jgi:putative aldouronate transport system permease protein
METIKNITVSRVRARSSAMEIMGRIKRGWRLYVLLVLPLIYLIVFKYYPMYGAQIAFKDFFPTKGISGSEWVGLKHFIRFFNSFEFARLMQNTLLLSLYSLLAGFPLPILLALSLNYTRNKFFKKSVQMITYAPHFISVVVMAGIILALLDPGRGLVNHLFNALGFESVNFMAKPDYFKSIFVWSDVWQNTGFSCIIYLAALSGIDPALHEAAIMDGATKIRRMWHIDLPGIMPIAIILLILNTGHVLDIGFEKVLLLQNALNLRTSEVIDTYVYKVGLTSQAVNYSYSAAIGFFKSIIGFILLITINKIAQKIKQASLW